MTVLIRRDTLADFRRQAAAKRREIQEKIRKIDELGDAASEQTKDYRRTLQSMLAPRHG